MERTTRSPKGYRTVTFLSRVYTVCSVCLHCEENDDVRLTNGG